MKEISDLLHHKSDEILEEWKEKIRANRKIKTSQSLSDTALGNSLPKLITALVSAFSELTQQEEEEELDALIKASLDHGTHRAKEGYNAAEIAREYRILRQTIFEFLEPNLLQRSSSDYHHINRVINGILDEAVSQCFHCFVEKTTEKEEQVRQELVLTNKELQRLLNLSQENFSSLAHELKTPLNSIMGYSQLLLRDISKTETEKSVSADRVDRVLNSSRLLLQLINESLEVSRHDSGRTSLKLRSVNVSQLLSSVVQTVEPIAKSKDLDLKVSGNLSTTNVITDSTRLQQILTNLISNAVRYTDKGSVEVTCKELPENSWSISVTDTGIGISEEDQEKIFDPFFRATSHRPGSTGLGLTIVARLVELLQGKIELESEAGEGSTFTVTFPIEVKDESISESSNGDGGSIPTTNQAHFKGKLD